MLDGRLKGGHDEFHLYRRSRYIQGSSRPTGMIHSVPARA
jgi:hypothetical protein